MRNKLNVHDINNYLVRNKLLLYVLLVGASIVVLFLFARHNYNSGNWIGTHEIHIYPEGSSSKNYKVNADMEVLYKPQGLWGKKAEYNINYIMWPNGGTTEFQCIVIPSENKNECTDFEFRVWRVEILSEPRIEDDSRA